MNQARPRYTPTYQSWQAMRQRCNNPKHTYYANYGGRGIKHCDAWDSFEQFRNDLGERPDGASLDRIDSDKGYTPENCRWATRSEQARNSSQNHLVTYGKSTRCLTEWCQIFDLSYHRVRARLVVLKWSTHDAFFR